MGAKAERWTWQTGPGAASSGNVVVFYALENHVSLRGLLGGGRSPAKPVSVARIPW